MKHNFFLLALLLESTITSTIAQSPLFKATTRKPADKVEFVSKGEKLLVNVSSVDGIGSATITRTEEKWPIKMIICFKLKYLEHIQISNGINTVEGRLGGDEWEVKPPQNGGLKANIQRTEAFIEAEVPAVLLQDDSKEIVVKWIDAYR
jgi:hypothetical protein